MQPVVRLSDMISVIPGVRYLPSIRASVFLPKPVHSRINAASSDNNSEVGMLFNEGSKKILNYFNFGSISFTKIISQVANIILL